MTAVDEEGQLNQIVETNQSKVGIEASKTQGYNVLDAYLKHTLAFSRSLDYSQYFFLSLSYSVSGVKRAISPETCHIAPVFV